MKQVHVADAPDTDSTSRLFRTSTLQLFPAFHCLFQKLLHNRYLTGLSVRGLTSEITLQIIHIARMKAGHAYTDSPSTEDHEELLMSSDGTSTSTNGDERWSRPKTWGLRRTAVASSIDNIREYRWVMTSGMLAVIICLQLVIWHEVRAQTCSNMVQVGSDYNGKTPTCSYSFSSWRIVAGEQFTDVA